MMISTTKSDSGEYLHSLFLPEMYSLLLPDFRELDKVWVHNSRLRNAQQLAVLRVVVREDFNRGQAERFVGYVEEVLKEMDLVPSCISVISGHVTAVINETPNRDCGRDTQKEITRYWKGPVDGPRIGVFLYGV